MEQESNTQNKLKAKSIPSTKNCNNKNSMQIETLTKSTKDTIYKFQTATGKTK